MIYKLGKLAFFIREGFGEEIFVDICSPLAIEAARQLLLIPFSEQLFNQIGMVLFFALSFIGCFYMVSKKFGTAHTFVFAISGGVFLSLGFITMFTGHGIIEHRWHFFSQMLLAIPLAVSLFLLCQISKKRFPKAVILSCIVFILAFFMIMSIVTIDNHTFAPNIGVRFAFIESELQAFDTVSGMWDGEIGADGFVILSFVHRFERDFIPIDKSLFIGDFKNYHDVLIMIRNDVIKRPVFIGGAGTISLYHDPRPLLIEQGFSRIYDSGSVAGFIK